MTNKPHVEIENMGGCKQAHLICNGWKCRVVSGELLWIKKDAFGAQNVCTDDALKLQKMIEDWGKS